MATMALETARTQVHLNIPIFMHGSGCRSDQWCARLAAILSVTWMKTAHFDVVSLADHMSARDDIRHAGKTQCMQPL